MGELLENKSSDGSLASQGGAGSHNSTLHRRRTTSRGGSSKAAAVNSFSTSHSMSDQTAPPIEVDSGLEPSKKDIELWTLVSKTIDITVGESGITFC